MRSRSAPARTASWTCTDGSQDAVSARSASWRRAVESSSRPGALVGSGTTLGTAKSSVNPCAASRRSRVCQPDELASVRSSCSSGVSSPSLRRRARSASWFASLGARTARTTWGPSRR